MSTISPIRKLAVFMTLVLLITFFGLIKYFSYESVHSFFRDEKKTLLRFSEIVITGEKKYISKQIANQYSRSTKSVDIRLIESAVLPLKLETVSLNRFYPFPDASGGITTAGNTLLIMDRLGHIYSFSNEKLLKLNTPNLPNNINNYILSSSTTLDSNSMRAQSMSFDPKTSRLYVG